MEWLAGGIRRSITGPMWHGSAIDELLVDVNHEQAAMTPIAGAHSIWELVLHMTVWTDIARLRAQGRSISPSSKEDWPEPNDISAREWSRDRERLREAHSALAGFVSTIPEKELDRLVTGYDYSLRTMLHGVIEHDCYHGGQIALLKKFHGETRA